MSDGMSEVKRGTAPEDVVNATCPCGRGITIRRLASGRMFVLADADDPAPAPEPSGVDAGDVCCECGGTRERPFCPRDSFHTKPFEVEERAVREFAAHTIKVLRECGWAGIATIIEAETDHWLAERAKEER